jgi:NitT/TauT family transport system substrate-binding protein
MKRSPLLKAVAEKVLPVIFGAAFLLALHFAIVGMAMAETHLSKVSFLPQWQPQAQFAGYYVAYEKGFFFEHGLDVRILRGGPERPSSEMLAQNRVDFVTLQLPAGLIQRDRGLKLLNICQLGQRSGLMLVAKKSSGIRVPEDLNGKKVGLWGEDFQGQLDAFFHKYHLQVKPIPQGTTMNLFLRGGVAVASAMWYNEYHLILNAGLEAGEITTFPLADYGLNFPEDGLYCLEQTYQEKPRLCRNFVQASLAGWRYAFAHPKEALDIVMKYANAAHVPTNLVHQKWMLARMQDLFQPDGSQAPLGDLNRETYYRVAEVLRKSGVIKHIPDYAHFYLDLAQPHEK